MPKKEVLTEALTMANTKKEMLEAYNEAKRQLEERRQTELKPERRVEERKTQEAVAVADSLSTEGIGREIGTLKSEIGATLARLSDRLEEEIAKYRQVKQAVTAKEQELEEIYEIERSATSLAALIEAQEQKRARFEADIAAQRDELEADVESTREEWLTERAAHDAETKERDAAEKKRRERDAEEYKYTFEREKQLAREEFDYAKAKLERETQARREEMEKDLSERERAVAHAEAELTQLRLRVDAFPKEIETAVKKAAEDTTHRLSRDAQNREELLKKDYEGQLNVLNSRIEALQRTVKEQSTQLAALSAQLEKSYGQVQDIAVKAIEGPSNLKLFAQPQPAAAEPPRGSVKGES